MEQKFCKQAILHMVLYLFITAVFRQNRQLENVVTHSKVGIQP